MGSNTFQAKGATLQSDRLSKRRGSAVALSLVEYHYFKVLLVNGASELIKVCPRAHKAAVGIQSQCPSLSVSSIPDGFGVTLPNSSGQSCVFDLRAAPSTEAHCACPQVAGNARASGS